VEKATGKMYAVKTIGKAPKRQASNPRYLLKLRTEVGLTMLQIAEANLCALDDPPTVPPTGGYHEAAWIQP
jgi:hypothetical protein